MLLKCDVCGNSLQMTPGGKLARCSFCGMEYPLERLREILLKEILQGTMSNQGTAPTGKKQEPLRTLHQNPSRADLGLEERSNHLVPPEASLLMTKEQPASEVKTVLLSAPSKPVVPTAKPATPPLNLKNEEFTIENGVLKKYNGNGGDVVIPEGVTEIGYLAFLNRPSPTSVSIPDSVTVIGTLALVGCKFLSSVNIPNSVTKIEGSAFSNCYSLTSVHIPDNVTTIGRAAFSCCSSLTSISIPKGVTKIDAETFADCTALTSVEIPGSVTAIGNSAFRDCTSLSSISIPNGVTEIGPNAFRDCSSLSSITIPSSVTSVGKGAFLGCPLKHVSFDSRTDFSGIKDANLRKFIPKKEVILWL